MFFQLFRVIWFSAAASFMLVSIGAGILQCFRRDKEWWDLPRFVLAPLMILWLVGAVSGIAAAILGVLEPIVGWLAHHFAWR
jgi:hypothetical protein